MSEKNICIVFRGELLRDPQSHHFTNKICKDIRECNTSKECIERQNDIMKSVIKHIIEPYKKQGYNVFVSGCVYECPKYNEKLKEFFPNHTIKQIKPGNTNQAELYHQSIDHVDKTHPNCIEYISIRADYIMLRDVIIQNNSGSYTGFAWKNKKFPHVDVFFIIGKKSINIFKKVLCKIGYKKKYVNTHSIIKNLVKHKIHLYPIWSDCENQATGLSYDDYKKDINLYQFRPFVNYMRYLSK